MNQAIDSKLKEAYTAHKIREAGPTATDQDLNAMDAAERQIKARERTAQMEEEVKESMEESTLYHEVDAET